MEKKINASLELFISDDYFKEKICNMIIIINGDVDYG